MHRLVFTHHPFAEQVCELWEGVLTLGRGPGNDLIVLDESVSGRHCQLLLHGTEVIVRDCASRNGTFVNEVRVTGQRGVYHGQRLRFGRVPAVLQLDVPLGESDTEFTAIHAHCREMKLSASSPGELPRKPLLIAPSRVPPAAS